MSNYIFTKLLRDNYRITNTCKVQFKMQEDTREKILNNEHIIYIIIYKISILCIILYNFI